MSKDSSPELWCDFDGTLVATRSKLDPRNWTKYPMNGMPGASYFLDGVSRSGVELAGVVSRRNARFRTSVTRWALKNVGLDRYFPREGSIVLAGSEERKGRFLVARSRERTVGMLEDKPDQLGKVMLGALAKLESSPATPHHDIVLGVVHHPQSARRLEGLLEIIDSVDRQVEVVSNPDESHDIRGEEFTLTVAQLPAYSLQAGQEFAQRLLQAG